ncbi:MAG: FHA domain-containing protein [Myxococcales bacterium]
MDRSLAIDHHADRSANTAATLVLIAGRSRSPSFRFERGDLSRRITVGPGPGCDWQVDTNGLAQVAMFFTGDSLWIDVERAHRLLLCNEQTLQKGWSRLDHGDRLKLGEVSIGVELAPDLRTQDASSVGAPSTQRSSQVGSNTENSIAAIMRLVRGSSERMSWGFRKTDIGIAITVGAGRNCDWSMTTGGHEIREVSLLYAGDTLLVRREQPGNRLRLDGEPLGEDWTFVPPGSRLEIGLACLELQVGSERSSLPPLPSFVRLPRKSPVPRGPKSGIMLQPREAKTVPELPAQSEPLITPPPAAVINTPLPAAKSESRPTLLPRQAQALARADLMLRSGGALSKVGDANSKLEAGPSAGSGRPRRNVVEMSKDTMEAKRPPEAWVQSIVPNQRRNKRTSRKLKAYALGGFVLAALYAAWVVLLDKV